MKKNNLCLIPRHLLILIEKIPNAMKLTFLFLVISLLTFTAEASAQKVSISLNNVKVEKILSTITKQTGLSVAYSKQIVNLDRRMSIQVEDADVAQVLEKLVADTNLSYEIRNNKIYLFEKRSETSAPAVLQQKKQISGTVTDTKGEPIIGANVVIKGTTTGTITDIDGHFDFEVPSGAVLQVSYIGYKSSEVPVNNQNLLAIQLREDQQALEEIVVVGYGVQKKVNLTGAVTQVTSKTLDSRPITSVGQGLQGVVPNLNVDLGDGSPGKAATFNIRGKVSLNDSNPLCLVDGVPMDINLLNPEDIESLSVLKDAASAAIYGARASAGVILVTTKSGKSNKDGKVRVSYTNNIQWSKPTRIPDMVNTLEYMDANNESSERTNGVGSRPYQDFWIEAVRKRMEDPANNPLTLNIDGLLYYCDNENYYDAVLRNASPRQKHTLSVSRGTEKTNFYLSAGYMNENGLIKLNPDDYKQYNINMSINTEINKYLSVGGSYKLNKGNIDEPHVRDNIGSIWYSLPGTPPYRPIQREDGHYMGQVTAYLAQAGRRLTDKMDNWISFNATLNLMPGWFVKSDFSYNRYSELKKSHLTKVTEAAEREDQYWIKDDTGIDMESRHNDQYIFNVFTQYDKSIRDHNFTALLGFNQEWKEDQYHKSTRKDLISENIPEINLGTGSEYATGEHSHEAIRGAFFRLGYNWKQRYLFEVNGRYDGSSKFPKDYRYKFFPSFSGAWRISEEAFMMNTKNVIDDMKIRLSYGTLGNQQVSNTLFYSLLNSEKIDWLFGSGQNIDRPTGVKVGDLVNFTPTWEKTTTINVGLDVALFSKLSGTFDVYNRKTTDMLTAGLSLPDILGATPPKTNAADLETKGWELSLTWRDELKNGLRYDISFNLADNFSKITKFSSNEKKLFGKDNAGNERYYVGQTLGEIWGFDTDGIYQSEEEVKAGPDQSALYTGKWEPGDVRYKDLDGDGKITYGEGTATNPGDQKVIGNRNPRFMYGINGNLEYKGFDLNIFFQGVGKRDMEFTNFLFWGPIKQGYTQITRELYENTWREDRRDAYYPSIKNASYNSLVQSRYIQNAAYIRLKNLTIGYTLPAQLTKKILFDKIRLYVSGQNLFECTPMVKTFDPETTKSAGDAYPFYRSFSFGIQVNL